MHVDFKKPDIHDIHARVKLHRTATGIVADFKVTFTADMTCVRCLEEFCNEFSVNIQLEYVEGKDPLAKTEKIELQRMDIDRVYYRGSQIDLSIGIREAIILAFPIAPVCSENCRGLCPMCGSNLNIQKCNCKIEKVGLFTPNKKKVKKYR